MNIEVSDITCPLCGRDELNSAGLLNIRGYKVHDKWGWWSHCLHTDHEIASPNGSVVELSDIWFNRDNTHIAIDPAIAEHMGIPTTLELGPMVDVTE